MAITRNGAMEFQGLSPELNDSTMLFNWLNRASGAGGIGTAGLRSQQYAQELLGQDRNKREMEQTMMREGLNKVRSSGGGGQSSSAGFGAPQGGGPRGGGMSPYEQELEGRNRASRDFEFQRGNTKKQRVDDMAHIRNLLAEYQKSKMGSGNYGNNNEGYSEQIFNSAGAPEVVRLKNSSPDRSSQNVDMQAIMNILMGAR